VPDFGNQRLNLSSALWAALLKHGFVAAIESIKPRIIIGVSTVSGTLTKDVVETMASLNERPVILSLSNPTEHDECTLEQAYTWSKGSIGQEGCLSRVE